MKTKLNKSKKIFIILSLFYILCIISIYSFSTFLPKSYGNLVLKQTILYVLGVILIYIIWKIGIKNILKYSYFIYVVNVFLLFAVLIFGNEINGARAWFSIPFIGSIQPSEFMKIGIILVLARIIDTSNINGAKDELILMVKVFVVIAIPSILTFLEPDTGAVIAYLVIGITMLFISKIRFRWFIYMFIIVALVGGIFFFLFFVKKDLFISIFGSNFFYRLDRLFEWSTSSGMQLENSLIAIGSSGLFGGGANKIPIYYPEGHTDFIFTSFASSFGLIGMILLIILIVIFDLLNINIARCAKKDIYKYVIMGMMGVLIYQQIENIAMTIGLLPIMGITLPFISYGGSSLLSFMILIGVSSSIEKENN